MGRASHNTDVNGWTWIFRKNKDNVTKPIGNPFQKDLEKVATSFYVTNLPDLINAKELWNTFVPFGRLADSFITNKRSKGGTWSINIIDESLESQSMEDENEEPKPETPVDLNSDDDLEELLDDLNESKGHNIVFSEDTNIPNNENIDIQNVEESQKAQHQSPKATSSHDFSRPPSFEDYKKELSSNSNCSTSFAKYGKKDTKGLSLINKMTRIIEVGDSLGYDVRGCHKSLKKMINEGDYFMINIYGPHEASAKGILWNHIKDFIHHHSGSFVLFGDLNEVRFDFERLGSSFSQTEADTFNSFINTSGLVELPLGGRSFTWMNKAGTKLNKLDQFLFSENVIEALPDVQITALDRLWSDHNPILLHCNKSDYGPTLFRFYHSWFNRNGFDDLISNEWNYLGQNSDNLLSHDKLKCLKAKIKDWLKITRINERHHKKEILNLEAKIDSNIASLEERQSRINLLHEIDKIDNLEALDLLQKSRIRWDIEGDENSKFFHCLVNQKRRNNSIHGIMHEGVWLTAPHQVKDTIYWRRTFLWKRSNLLSGIAVVIKRSGPMASPFGFIKRLWDLLKSDIKTFVSTFFDSKKMPVGSNSSFITLIPKFKARRSSVALFIHPCYGRASRGSYGSDALWFDSWFFYLASGLKINIHKSNVYGVGVSDNEVSIMANNTGCTPGSFPFVYLGLPIGANMNLTVNWKILLDRFDARLSKWKANLLSIGGASFFWGSTQDSRKVAWVKWPAVLASLDKGDIGIGSLKSFNLALLQKWRWRMTSNDKALWVKVIKSLHGQEGGFGLHNNGSNGIWAKIVGSSNYLHSNNILLSDSIRFRIGNGTSIRFWKDL
ncbi:RNA-directed DNA polymerase, eukaryota, reverse transcriptase zinc-binding domain protein [Tanacetum coccineum]